MDIEKKLHDSYKMLKLNFNLKNLIFSFLDFKQIITKEFILNFDFLNSLRKDKRMKFFKENYDYLLFQIDFSIEKYKKIKQEFTEFLEASEETYIQIYTHFLLKKYKKQKKLSFTCDSKTNIKVISYFIQNQIFIQILKLKDLSIANKPENLKYFTQSISINSSLQELFLEGNEIGKNDTDMKFFSQAFIKNNSIKILDLNWNEIGRNKLDLMYLSEALIINKRIEFLYLFNNWIGNNKEDMVYIKIILNENKFLKELDLSWNRIGDNIEDLKNLEEGLEENKTLLILNLTKNVIDNNKNIENLRNKNPNIIINSYFT